MPTTFDPGGLTEFGSSGGGFPIDPSGFSLFGGGGGGGFGIDPTGFNFSSGGFGGLGDLMGQFFLDTTTGQTFSGAQIINDPTLWADFSQQQGLTDAQTMAQVQATRQLFNQMGGSGAGGNQLNPYITAALLGLPSAVGIGGLIQGLTGGGQSTTQVTQPGQSATAQAAQQAALQGFQGAQQFAFGNPQANQMSNATGQVQPGAGGLASQLQGMAPVGQQASLAALQGLIAQLQGNPFAAGTLQPQLAQQVQGYGQAQSPLLALGGLGAMGLQNPAAGALGQQAQGMAQGNLPALSPALRQQVGATFEPQRQEIARYLDQALQGALERSRQQGFAGGTEVFREGTPAALLAPGLAEATRQQGVLGGQQAAMELSLAQSLPMQGGNLANQLFQQQLSQNQALQQAAQGYTTPLSVALGGGLNLSNLNQNIIQALGGFGQQGTANQLDFLRAISAPLGGLSGLSNTAQLGAG